VCGVITDDGTKFEADVVIVAAGVGSKDLSGVDVIRQPGVIALTKSVCTKFNADREGVDLAGNAPRRVLVDTINEAHILQRRGGELAIGGGYLQVGGVASVSQLGRLAEKKEDERNAAAKEIPGLFCVVSHSGITLGPLLGELAAIELQLCHQTAASELLEDYRPTRFGSDASP